MAIFFFFFLSLQPPGVMYPDRFLADRGWLGGVAKVIYGVRECLVGVRRGAFIA